MRDHTIVSVGELLVEFVSHVKGCALEHIGEYSGPYPSGAPAIFLNQAARMGARSEMFGGVGNDGFGRALLKRLREDKVGTRGVTIAPALSTGTAFVSYYNDGSRDFIFHVNHTAAIAFEVNNDIFAFKQVALHVSGSSLGSAPLRRMIMSMVRAVLEAGGRITCDPNALVELMRDDEARAALEEVVAESYCLLPSTSDLGFLFPALTEEAGIEQLLNSRTDVVAIKRGAAGVTVVASSTRYDFKDHEVDEIDPTGAGDCFCGTFVSLLSQGVPLADAGRRANAVGAIAVTRRGPMEGNSTPNEITAFLADREPESENSTQ